MAANRTTFLVDGFNLYHSLRDASSALGGASTKWLDLRSICRSYLPAIGGGAQIETVFYFSALASYKLAGPDIDAPARHRDYMSCLKQTGVDIELGNFKAKKRRCRGCSSVQIYHEEKETDVALGVKLVEVFARDLCDTAVLVTGDNDLAPAIRCAKTMYPEKQICALFPYLRIGYSLQTLVDRSWRMKPARYVRHQLPNPCSLSDGTLVHRPGAW